MKRIEIDIDKTHFIFESNNITEKTAFEYAKMHQARNPYPPGPITFEISEEDALKQLSRFLKHDQVQDEDKSQ